jgi:hypothetical protein
MARISPVVNLFRFFDGESALDELLPLAFRGEREVCLATFLLLGTTFFRLLCTSFPG